MSKKRTQKGQPSPGAREMLLNMAEHAEQRGSAALAETYRTRAEKYAPTAKAETPTPVKLTAPERKAGGHSPAFLAGVASARQRFEAVVNCQYFKGREARACAYLQTSMPADEIIALLSDTPKAAGAFDEAAQILEAVRRSNAEGASNDATAAHKPAPWASVVQDINARNGF